MMASALSFRQKTGFAPLAVPGLARLWPNGLPRGALCEIHGPRSSGRTAACLHILAQATERGEICAVVDANDAFDPAAAAAAGVKLERLLWVRCRGNLEHAMRAADLLLHAGGFGVVALDLCETNPRLLNRIPLSYWHRFRRAVEHTPAVLLLCGDLPQGRKTASRRVSTRHAGVCAPRFHGLACAKGVEWQVNSSVSNKLSLKVKVFHWRGLLLRGLSASAAIENTRGEPLEIEMAA